MNARVKGGTYLCPQGFGQPEMLGLDYQRNLDMFAQLEAEPPAPDR